MDSRALICLEVPSIFCKCEVQVPQQLKVKDLVPLLVNAVSEYSHGQYMSSGHEFLCSKRHELLLDDDATLEYYGIGNGDHLVLL